MINTITTKPMNYGLISPGGSDVGKVENVLLKPAEIFYAQSGKFVKRDGTDDMAVAGSGDTQIEGWATVQGVTGSVSGFTVPAATIPTRVTLINDLNARFVMPADAAVTAAIINLTCDLITTLNVQYADVGESNEDVIVIYDVCVALQLVEVGLNAAKMHVAGVA